MIILTDANKQVVDVFDTVKDFKIATIERASTIKTREASNTSLLEKFKELGIIEEGNYINYDVHNISMLLCMKYWYKEYKEVANIDISNNLDVNIMREYND